jgi:serine/threonine protein kinase
VYPRLQKRANAWWDFKQFKQQAGRNRQKGQAGRSSQKQQARADSSEKNQGGCILMKYGEENFTSEALWSEAVSGVTESLSRAHRAGVVQRDIRQSNILSFSGHWQLIDYGLAGLEDDLASVQVSSSQARHAGALARQRILASVASQDERGEVHIVWKKEDDWAMLALLRNSSWRADAPFSMQSI